MILISHRGNIDGSIESFENEPEYLDLAMSKGFDVEVDIWVIDDIIFLGHDKPQYRIDIDWLVNRLNKLWLHCKNINAIIFLKTCEYNFNYFWHESDVITLTSFGYIWSYPGYQPIKYSISVMPEIYSDDLSQCIGICSDYIGKYKINH